MSQPKLNAKELNEKFKKMNPSKTSPVDEAQVKADAEAKAIVESLIENDFSKDAATAKDAVTEMAKLVDSKSPVAKKMLEMFNAVSSACKVEADGSLTLKTEGLKTKF